MSKKKRPLPQSLNLPPIGVDTHAHLDLAEFVDDLSEVLERAKQSGICQIGNVFLGPEAYKNSKNRLDLQNCFFYLLGIHPNDSENVTETHISEMEFFFQTDQKLKAVGEIGLDYFHNKVTSNQQKRIFRLQLELAKSCDKPVVIHSRNAFADTIAILDDMGFQKRPLLWHCFTENIDNLQAILQRDWQISIPGPVSYKKNTALQEAVAACPLNRLLLETDAPFLAPEPWRGKRNEPAFTVFTAQKIAELKQIPAAELWQQCGDNARIFFGLEQ